MEEIEALARFPIDPVPIQCSSSLSRRSPPLRPTERCRPPLETKLGCTGRRPLLDSAASRHRCRPPLVPPQDTFTLTGCSASPGTGRCYSASLGPVSCIYACCWLALCRQYVSMMECGYLHLAVGVLPALLYASFPI
jgi:hypothetical protein